MKKFDDILLKVRRGTWRTTTLRLIRAERELERGKVLHEAAEMSIVLMKSVNDQAIAHLKELEAKLVTLQQEKQELASRLLEQAKTNQDTFNAGRQTGQNDVLNLIARWGRCRPLAGMNGADMAKALRKVIEPTIAPYNDYEGITSTLQNGELVNGTHPANNGAHHAFGPLCDPPK